MAAPGDALPASHSPVSRRAVSTLMGAETSKPSARASGASSLSLDCHALTELSPTWLALPRLRSLSLALNALTDVDEDAWAGCVTLDRLSLKGNRLRGLPPALARLRHLRALDVAGNQVVDVTVLALPCLEEVRLEYNRVRDASALAALPALAVLDMSANVLHSLLPSQHLRHLCINRNAVEQLWEEAPLAFAGRLHVLELAQNRLSLFPALWCTCTNLISLVLGGNNLRNLPDELIHLGALQRLVCSENALQDLPPLPASLVLLNVAYNELQRLPDHLGRLALLTTLDASHNVIEAVSPALAQCVSLTQLLLSHNRLDQVPECLAVLPLALLDLRDDACLAQLPTSLLTAPCVRSSLPDEIVSGLFLGPATAARNRSVLRSRHIARVLQVVDGEPAFADVNYLVLPMDDTDAQLLAPLLPQALAWIHAALGAGEGVLVHCEFGRSRSATVVIAYLMKARSWCFDEALAHIVKQRPSVNPNASFRRQLAGLDCAALRLGSE